jgi:cellulose synthase/poly-beta-1,6-N-acetylglucosamine synthase-like glycosyltransferase
VALAGDMPAPTRAAPSLPLDPADSASTQCDAVVLTIVALVLGAVFGAYWIAPLVFVHLHLRWTNTRVPTDESDAGTTVTVIHPIKDRDHELELNLDSWIRQDYRGPVQHIFSFQDPEDPALPAVRALERQWPHADISIIVTPLLPGLNGKSSNMVHALAIARHDVVLFGDSDTRVRPDFTLKMVRPLRNPRAGVTTCGQVNIGGRDFWTRFSRSFELRDGLQLGVSHEAGDGCGDHGRRLRDAA